MNSAPFPGTVASARMDYASLPNVFDWMREPQGSTRPGWERIEHLLRGESEPLDDTFHAAQRLIHRNGVTYNVYADPRGIHRPWALDPIPLVISAAEWRSLEIGLEQRARLFDALARDIYGQQRILKEKLLPPELLFANPGYLRACHRLLPNDAPMIVLHGTEVVRDLAGRLVVRGDRTQAPSGSGYALENRVVMSQTLRQEFRAHPVQRLASFFRDYRDTLHGLADGARENPLIVLLTPGPYNESYFEHSYLASYLGLALVQGADLAVRDAKVYLKTLGGLERVDVIVRRVDDMFCDPLSLRGDSALGVPGLVHAVRAGNVAVANALGTGVVETRALLPYLPRIAQALLGEDAKLACVDTYYCGDEGARAFVIEHLDEMVLLPTFPGTGRPRRTIPAQLSTAQKRALMSAIESEPTAWVAQRDLGLATTPAWVDGQVVPRPVGLRTFAARSGEGYRVLPGGLVRVGSEARTTDVSMQLGSGSKDCWVLSEQPVIPVTLLHKSGQPLAVSRGGGDLPSRAADDLFWLGRYIERADGTSRLMRTLSVLLADDAGGPDASCVPPLVHALAIHTELEAELPNPAEDTTLEHLERELLAFLLSDGPPRSLRSVLKQAQRVAFAVRDRISHDSLRALQNAVDVFDGARGVRTITLAEAIDLLDAVVIALGAFEGLGFDGLSRGHGHRFAEMGRRLERAFNTSRLVNSTLASEHEDEIALLFSLLRILDSTGSYRRRYRGAIEVAPVVDLLVFDERNPRSVAFQLAALEALIADLPGARVRPHRRIEDRTVFQSLARLRLSDAEAVCQAGEERTRTELESLLSGIADDMLALSDALTRSYFAHAVPRLSVSGLGQEST